MKEIEKIIKIEVLLGKQFMIFQLLGQFGDRLSKDVQDEMRYEAEYIEKKIDKLRKR
jgi:hypothetical protein